MEICTLSETENYWKDFVGKYYYKLTQQTKNLQYYTQHFIKIVCHKKSFTQNTHHIQFNLPIKQITKINQILEENWPKFRRNLKNPVTKWHYKADEF